MTFAEFDEQDQTRAGEEAPVSLLAGSNQVYYLAGIYVSSLLKQPLHIYKVSLYYQIKKKKERVCGNIFLKPGIFNLYDYCRE